MRTKLILGAAGALGLLWAQVGQAYDGGYLNADATPKFAVTKYASETLSSANNRMTAVEGKSYYYITDTNNFVITRTLQADGASSGESGVRFKFTNLLFVGNDSSDPTTSSKLTVAAATGGTPAALSDDNIRRYGSDGTAEKSVSTWAVTGLKRGHVLTLNLGNDVAISGDGPVTVELVVTGGSAGSSLFDDVTAADNNVSPTAILEAANAINVSTMGMNQIASVDKSFMRFKPGGGVANNGLLASLGTFEVKVNAMHKHARSSADVDLTHLYKAGVAGPPMLHSRISLNGELAFVKKVSLQYPADSTPDNVTDRRFCDDTGGGTQLLTPATATAAAKIAKIPLSTTATQATKELCIELYDPDSDSEGEKASQIPAGDYSASLEFTPADDASDPDGPGRDAAMPPGTKVAALGSITRDGSSVAIPVMYSHGTEGRYGQRISIMNNNARAVGYGFTFKPEPGTTVTAGSKAMGTLAANATTVLKVRDVVTVSGNIGRTAGTIDFVASKGTVEVAVVLVDRNEGSTSVLHATAN